jgi:hypothetical protein
MNQFLFIEELAAGVAIFVRKLLHLLWNPYFYSQVFPNTSWRILAPSELFSNPSIHLIITPVYKAEKVWRVLRTDREILGWLINRLAVGEIWNHDIPDCSFLLFWGLQNARCSLLLCIISF